MIFTLMMFMVLMLTAGLAIDVMRHETTRIKLQNTLDRAILAAADLDQELDPELVVRDYFEKAGMDAFLNEIDVQGDPQGSFRIVTATASVDMPTFFLRIRPPGLRDWEGIDTLHAAARGQAEERVSNVEISLVLDISGSMGGSKIATLRDAAKDFIDTVVRDSVEDLVSLSLIPYTGQVNAGPVLLNEINLAATPRHNFSHCLEFEAGDFTRLGLHPNSLGIAPSHTYRQGQHIQNSYSSFSSGLSNPPCPQQSYERIIPLSQDRTQLKNAIGSFQSRSVTAIHTGMKWATILLDPTTQPIIERISDSTQSGPVEGIQIDEVFKNRPAPWTDNNTMKVVILMTDGVNVGSNRLKRDFYDSPSEYAFWATRGTYNYPYYYGSGNIWDYIETDYTSTQANNRLDQVCDLAKDNNIIVFSIGFEVSNTSANVMRNCATTDAHFFRVEGTEISKAFDTIANQINQLRLTF